MLLTKTFTPEIYARALDSWAWLPVRKKVPVLSSLFGDVFMQDSKGYWFLDSMEGSLNQVAKTRDEVQAILDSEDGQDRFLLGGLAWAADRSGLTLKSSEIYVFKIPPVLGGKTVVDNIMVMDFVVWVYMAGQLHDQVRKMKPGTRITGFEISE